MNEEEEKRERGTSGRGEQTGVCCQRSVQACVSPFPFLSLLSTSSSLFSSLSLQHSMFFGTPSGSGEKWLMTGDTMINEVTFVCLPDGRSLPCCGLFRMPYLFLMHSALVIRLTLCLIAECVACPGFRFSVWRMPVPRTCPLAFFMRNLQ